MATRSSVPAKVATRLKDSLKRVQPVLSSALSRDVNESDTARTPSIAHDMHNQLNTFIREQECNPCLTAHQENFTRFTF